MSYQPNHAATHQCLVCGKMNARINASGWGDGGQQVETTCPDCKSIGHISNMKPWYGTEMPIDTLRAIFTLAGIPILGEPLKLQNRYWQGHDTAYYHPWWFVKTSRGWIEIGWRKRVISIGWRDTDIRRIVTTDDVTKGDDCVHAYSEAKATEYLTALWAPEPEKPSTAHSVMSDPYGHINQA